MRHISKAACFTTTLVVLFTFSVLAQAAVIRLGLLAADEQLGEVAEAAYDWAATQYQTTILIADDSGGFSDAKGSQQALDRFAVLWLHYSETNALPDVFLADATKDAVMSYLESGGTMFLTALGIQCTFELGLQEDPNPRNFTPLGKEPPEIGVVPTAEGAKHPIFSGFDTSGPIYLCSMDQPGNTSDFMNSGELQGTLLATKTRGGGAGAGERPIVEFDVGKGKIITLAHHNAIYTDDRSDESENLRKLTTNIVEYLAANSAFMSVKPIGKLTAAWGGLKLLDCSFPCK